MAKGQARSSKEKKKPAKTEKDKPKQVSAYKAALGLGPPTVNPLGKKI